MDMAYWNKLYTLLLAFFPQMQHIAINTDFNTSSTTFLSYFKLGNNLSDNHLTHIYQPTLSLTECCVANHHVHRYSKLKKSLTFLISAPKSTYSMHISITFRWLPNITTDYNGKLTVSKRWWLLLLKPILVFLTSPHCGALTDTKVMHILFI